MEQIIIVLNKNPADSPEFTHNIVNTSKTIRKLIEFEDRDTQLFKDQTKQFTKEINFTIEQIQKRMLQKDLVFEEIEKYVIQACKQNQQEKMDSNDIKNNI